MATMARPALYTTLFMFATRALATYDQFYFTTNATLYQCPDSPFACPAPQACVHDGVLDKWYCCAPGEGSVCWSPDAGCNGTPSSTEISCGSGDYTYCCLKTREECTQTTNQINICWARATENSLTNATTQQMNETYSSLSSAAPSATALSFSLAQLFPSSSSSASTSSSTTATSASVSAPSSTTSPTSAPTSSDSGGLSGGAIAGIVIGALAGLAIIAAAAFFFYKRKSKSTPKGSELDGTHSHNPYANGNGAHGAYGAMPNGQQEKFAHEMPSPRPDPAPVELDARTEAVEIDGNNKYGDGTHT